MWTYEYSDTTDKDPSRIWARYRDHSTWVEWDQGLDAVEAEGPFAVGTQGKLTPKGRDPIPFVIASLEDGRSFSDECTIGDLTIRFTHELEPLTSGGTRVTHAVQITGPGAEQAGPAIGPAVTADIPDSVATLIRLA